MFGQRQFLAISSYKIAYESFFHKTKGVKHETFLSQKMAQLYASSPNTFLKEEKMNIMTAVEFSEMVAEFAHQCSVCGHTEKAHRIFSDGSVTCSPACTEAKNDALREEVNEAY